MDDVHVILVAATRIVWFVEELVNEPRFGEFDTFYPAESSTNVFDYFTLREIEVVCQAKIKLTGCRVIDEGVAHFDPSRADSVKQVVKGRITKSLDGADASKINEQIPFYRKNCDTGKVFHRSRNSAQGAADQKKDG